MNQNYRKARVASAGLALAFAALLAALPQASAQDSSSPPTSTIGEQPGDAPASPPPAGTNSPANQPVPQNGEIGPQTYTQDETMAAAKNFFGGTTEGLAKAIEKVFSDNGRPNAYIVGQEGSGAVILGLRYGEGTLYYKGGGSMKVYWQGPSVGWDFGGNASKVFTLVYNLHWTRDLFQRFPGVDGSLYIVAGVGLNYQRANNITLAPIRTGVGLRAGANVGYLSYTEKKTWIPF
ncbi:DUF1134 domain-containing protein [Nevskia soli]|uniref:DUF1134 domain-containing protein n=1 Tax=Nevskia soli TaxID=418856 RepID=UPI000691BA78|nr:DUF1134 domain-containing protein [Nevskia soli]